MPNHFNDTLIPIAKEVLQQEAQALIETANHLDESINAICDRILDIQHKGKIILTGMGKSGHIAKKIAATFASTGTPSFYIHPSEALHGDMGMIEKQDIVFALSFSGENDELITLLPFLQHHHIDLIAMTGNADSSLAQAAQFQITLPKLEEACPLGLAPTTSTTVMLAIGDALAIALLHARGFTRDDFAKNHPQGKLGKQLLLTANDVAKYDNDLPLVSMDASIADTILVMSEKRMGIALIKNAEQTITGIFTDGDLRRTVEKKIDLHQTPIKDVMHLNPITIPSTCPLGEALYLMNDKRITTLLIKNHQNNIGVIQMHDILATRAFNEA